VTLADVTPVLTEESMRPYGAAGAYSAGTAQAPGVGTEAAENADVPVIHFPAGLVGFPQARHFVLVRADDSASPAWFTLRCLEQDSLRFLVADPARFYGDYAPEIDDATATRLGLSGGAQDQALVLVVVTLGQRDEDATANLFAPLVLNRTTRQGAQAVLSGSRWSLREPLYS
jgi:flagellar assembly factor FliW